MTTRKRMDAEAKVAYDLFVSGRKLGAVAHQMGLEITAAARRIRAECERRHGHQSLVRLCRETGGCGWHAPAMELELE